jgi:hypothetical protein
MSPQLFCESDAERLGKSLGKYKRRPFEGAHKCLRNLVAGVDLNHRPLGYEPKEISNFNNLQDAGGYLKAL